MKQIDILRHAKDYLMQLDRHMDPVSGTRLPAGSAGYDDNLHRLFFLCAKDLERIINYDDVANRPPFSITAEEKQRLVPTNGWVTIFDLLNRINRVVDTSRCRGLGQTTLSHWLVKQGYLRTTKRGNKICYFPTPKGEAQGFKFQAENGHLHFDRNAQQFVFDHLDDISQSLQRPEILGRKQRRRSLDHPEALKRNLKSVKLLSQGRHPFTEMPLKPDDPLCQERLLKCFSYVAQAFTRTLEAGYFTAKVPFTLPQELWGKISVTEEPTVLSAYIAAVNDLLPDPTAVQPLSHVTVLEYLSGQEFLQMNLTKTGRKTYKLTPQGNALGIAGREATDKNGMVFTTLFYSRDAQNYLSEHMGEVIAFAAR